MMMCTWEQIKDITLGAAWMFQDEEGVHLHRFTKEQEALYHEKKPDLAHKVYGTAGIKMAFVTDSESLTFCVLTKRGSSRTYFSLDVEVNGERIDALNNFQGDMKNYTQDDFPLGTYEKTFALGKGEKRVWVYFPWSVETVVKTMTLDDGASLTPIVPPKKVLIYGDSISQGYDAKHSCNRYGARLCKALSAEERNKAIGGEVFFPELLNTKEDFDPDYVIVAYGTNDWKKSSKAAFLKNAPLFYETISRRYSQKPVFVITPLWRKDSEDTEFGPFSQMEGLIYDMVKDLPNVTVVSGLSLVPHEETAFGDFRLHPHDESFGLYAERLLESMKKVTL